MSLLRDEFFDKMVGMNHGSDFYIEKKRDHRQMKRADRYLVAQVDNQIGNKAKQA
jgi:hypothetical protein